MSRRIKVFLSHRSADKPLVEGIAESLRREANVEPWLDKWNLVPGQPWQTALEDAILACDCCAVFVGPRLPERDTFGPWHHAEMRALIARQIEDPHRRFAVIPVLLPGADREVRSALVVRRCASNSVRTQSRCVLSLKE